MAIIKANDILSSYGEVALLNLNGLYQQLVCQTFRVLGLGVVVARSIVAILAVTVIPFLSLLYP